MIAGFGTDLEPYRVDGGLQASTDSALAGAGAFLRCLHRRPLPALELDTLRHSVMPCPNIALSYLLWSATSRAACHVNWWP